MKQISPPMTRMRAGMWSLIQPPIGMKRPSINPPGMSSRPDAYGV